MSTSRHAYRYSFARDGLEVLAIDPGTQDLLKNIIDEDPAYGVRLDAGINQQVAKHGVTATGEWLGDWEVADVTGPLIAEFMLLAQLDEAAAAASAEAATLSNVQRLRDVLIYEARESGISAATLAERTGLNVSRIRQILACSALRSDDV